MNILFVYYNHNDRYSVISNSILSAFKSCGHHVVTCGRSNRKAGGKKLNIDMQKSEASIAEIFSLLKKRHLPNPDILFHCWPTNHFFISDPENSPVPTGVYAIDSHIPFVKIWLEGYLLNFDIKFCNQLNFSSKLKSQGSKNVYWMPLGYDPLIHKDYNHQRTKDVVFVGTNNIWQNPKRYLFLKYISAKFDLLVASNVYHKKMSRLYSQAKIGLNTSIFDDLNARVFEVMASGALLVTPKKQFGLLKLFKNNVHLVCYEDMFDCIIKIDYFLKNPSLRKKIANFGKSEVLKNHSYPKRISEIVRIFKSAPPRNRKISPLDSLKFNKSVYLMGKKFGPTGIQRLIINVYRVKSALEVLLRQIL